MRVGDPGTGSITAYPDMGGVPDAVGLGDVDIDGDTEGDWDDVGVGEPVGDGDTLLDGEAAAEAMGEDVRDEEAVGENAGSCDGAAVLLMEGLGEPEELTEAVADHDGVTGGEAV